MLKRPRPSFCKKKLWISESHFLLIFGFQSKEVIERFVPVEATTTYFFCNKNVVSLGRIPISQKCSLFSLILVDFN